VEIEIRKGIKKVTLRKGVAIIVIFKGKYKSIKKNMIKISLSHSNEFTQIIIKKSKFKLIII